MVYLIWSQLCFPWKKWTASIPWTLWSLPHFSYCQTKKNILRSMMSPMSLWLIPNHFYLQRSERVSMTIPCHSHCYTHIFCLLKIITEQIICSALYTKKSTYINGCRNRFHFQIKQQADITENKNFQYLGPPDCCWCCRCLYFTYQTCSSSSPFYHHLYTLSQRTLTAAPLPH